MSHSYSESESESNYKPPYYMTNDLEKQDEQMCKILQNFADQGLLRVERFDRINKRDSGHVVDILDKSGNHLTTMAGWLAGQDKYMGWRETYTKWTNVLDDEYIEILLMINRDVLPILPEFAGCKNQAACNLDYFGDYKIKIKRDHVADYFD
jgi:hypothetical protein